MAALEYQLSDLPGTVSPASIASAIELTRCLHGSISIAFPDDFIARTLYDVTRKTSHSMTRQDTQVEFMCTWRQELQETLAHRYIPFSVSNHISRLLAILTGIPETYAPTPTLIDRLERCFNSQTWYLPVKETTLFYMTFVLRRLVNTRQLPILEEAAGMAQMDDPSDSDYFFRLRKMIQHERSQRQGKLGYDRARVGRWLSHKQSTDGSNNPQVGRDVEKLIGQYTSSYISTFTPPTPNQTQTGRRRRQHRTSRKEATFLVYHNSNKNHATSFSMSR